MSKLGQSPRLQTPGAAQTGSELGTNGKEGDNFTPRVARALSCGRVSGACQESVTDVCKKAYILNKLCPILLATKTRCTEQEGMHLRCGKCTTRGDEPFELSSNKHTQPPLRGPSSIQVRQSLSWSLHLIHDILAQTCTSETPKK